MGSKNIVSDDAQKPLLVQKNRWTQRQLLKNILARYFDIIDDAGGIWPSWLVKLEDSEDPHLALENLNHHLDKLDWMAKLTIDKPFCVRIYPKPTGIFNLSNKYKNIMWIISALSVWAMGTYWIYNLGGYDNYLDTNLLSRSLIMYTLPLIAGLWFASKVQTLLSRGMDMRVGGILPILIPIPLPSWPFGIAAIPSHPRMEAIPWPDRKRLGVISIIAPLILILIGFLYLIIGLFLTQIEAPEFTSEPTKINLPFFTEILSIFIIGESKANLLTNWIHPIGLAGMFLLTTGWICMLPFPTLPGGRALVAIMGSKSAKSSSTQIWLFFILFLIGMFYSIFEGSSFWTFVVIAGIMLVFFHGSDERIPMLLNDIKPLKEETKSKLSIVLILSLLMALPAEYPLEQVENWDSKLVPEWEESYTLEVESEFEIALNIYNPSLKNLEWGIDLWPESKHIDDWNLTLNCPDKENTKTEFRCDSISISPYSRKIVYLNGFLPNIENLSSIIEIKIGFKQMGDVEFSKITLIPKTSIIPTKSHWNWNGEYSSPVPELCVNLSIGKGVSGELSIDDMWEITKPSSKIINENIASESIQEICAEGEEGVMQIYSMQEVPSVNLNFNSEDINLTWEILLSNNLTKISSGKNVWNISGMMGPNTSDCCSGFEILEEDSNTQYSTEIQSDCNYEMWATYPEMINQTYFVDYDQRNSLLFPSIEYNETLELKLPNNGRLAICENNNPNPSKIWDLALGPNLILSMDENGTEIVDWIGTPLVVIGNCEGCINQNEGEINFTLTNYGNNSVEVKKELHGPTSVFETFEGLKLDVGPSNSEQISLKWNLEDGDAYLVSWMEVDNTGDVYLHLSVILG